MTEASRSLSEYGDLSRLPLFSQPTNGSTPAAPKLGAPVTAPPPSGPDVDWPIVAELRARASEQLSQAVASDRGRLDKAAQQELGRSIVLDLIESAMADDVDAGRGAWSPARQQATAQAVRWRGPDGKERNKSFKRKIDADRFAATVSADLVRGQYVDPDAGKILFETYARRWLAAQRSMRAPTLPLS